MSVCSCRSLAEGCSLPGTPGVVGSRHGKRRCVFFFAGRVGPLWPVKRMDEKMIRGKADGVAEDDFGVKIAVVAQVVPRPQFR